MTSLSAVLSFVVAEYGRLGLACVWLGAALGGCIVVLVSRAVQ